ncbi:MAG: hypothetical protein LBH76_08205 [Propionibacteriaceae bacterium]|nr:hypothetical protein [Propionibacteriaceae bacterium]
MNHPERHALAARLVIAETVQAIAANHAWTLNEALTAFAKSTLYPRLLDLDTELWHHNPLDIADMFDHEWRGEPIPLDLFYP